MAQELKAVVYEMEQPQIPGLPYGEFRGWGNGYVFIPEGHPLHGVQHHRVGIQCALEITGTFRIIEEHLDGDSWDPALTPEDVGMWAIGFDTNHNGNTLTTWPKDKVRDEAEKLLMRVSQGEYQIYDYPDEEEFCDDDEQPDDMGEEQPDTEEYYAGIEQQEDGQDEDIEMAEPESLLNEDMELTGDPDPMDEELQAIVEKHAAMGFLDRERLLLYTWAYILKLNIQTHVYTTIGSDLLESPMWFIPDGITDKDNDYKPFSFVGRDTSKDNELHLCMRFKSSQNEHMFFNIPVDTLTAARLSTGDNKPVFDFFREIKYAFMKKHWPTVYQERKERDPLMR